jgi:hypothetical protein
MKYLRVLLLAASVITLTASPCDAQRRPVHRDSKVRTYERDRRELGRNYQYDRDKVTASRDWRAEEAERNGRKMDRMILDNYDTEPMDDIGGDD